MKNKKIKNIFLIIFLSLLFLLVNVVFSQNPNTNIDETYRYAWNNIFGWLDFYITNTVKVNSLKIEGYASSSIGYISLDCATSPNGNICSSAEYGVCNGKQFTHQNGDCQEDEAYLGYLSGYAWNDVIGWISFCGGENNFQCPGDIPYNVFIDNEGNFRGYAWNDNVGWISFNSQNYGGDIEYYVKTSWRPEKISGFLESSIFDTQTYGTLNSIIWQGEAPLGTCVKFQIAASNNANGPWLYLGSGQSPTSYFPGDGCAQNNIPVEIKGQDRHWLKNNRYLRYKVILESDLFQRKTPVIKNIILNWSP